VRERIFKEILNELKEIFGLPEYSMIQQ
jgi:hypothetical protein